MQLSILRFGQLTRMQVRSESVEEANGDLVSFRIENGTGRKASLMEGKVEGGQLIIKTTQNGQTENRFYAWRAGIKSPVYQDRMVRRYPMKPREIRRFDTFLPDVGRTTQVRLAAEGYRMVKLRNGKRRKLLRVRVNQAVNPTETVNVYLDEKGVPVVSSA